MAREKVWSRMITILSLAVWNMWFMIGMVSLFFVGLQGKKRILRKKMCESFVNMINQGKENMKFLEENAKNLPEQYEAEK